VIDYHEDIDPTSLADYPLIIIVLGLTAVGATDLRPDSGVYLFAGIAILYIHVMFEMMLTRRKIYRALKDLDKKTDSEGGIDS